MDSFDLENHADAPFFTCIADLFATPEVQSLALYEQHLEINRLQHVISVAYLSYLACRKLEWDYTAAARGAILHDLFYYDWRVKDPERGLHGYAHPRFALQNAGTLCGDGLSKKEADIIRRHMWPLTLTPPRYRESFIVSMSDKYCAARELYFSLAPRFFKRARRMPGKPVAAR